MSSTETFLARTLLWTSVGVAAGFPTLVLPAPVDPRLTVVIHLVVLGVFVIGLALHLAPLTDEPWFAGRDLGTVGRRAVTWVTTVTAVTASAATVAAVTAASLRYDPSMQYFVVLGADAAALPVAMAILGGRRGFGTGPAVAIGAVLGAAVVWSLWHYLDLVGVGVDGSWVVDGARFGSLVLPVLGGSLGVGIGLFTVGVRRQ